MPLLKKANCTSRSCPCCGKSFQCRPEAITSCQCFGVLLSEERRTALGEKYEGCLCRECLLEWSKKVVDSGEG